LTHSTDGAPSTPLILWQLTPAEHRSWVLAGCGTGTEPEYSAVLARAKELAVATGRRVVMFRATVAEVLAQVRSMGLRPSAPTLEFALSVLHGKKRHRP
jgi:hypothetical protein